MVGGCSNGNLRQLRRNAHGTANAMDDLFYFYKAHNNQLTRVTDAVTGAPFASDLPSGQAADNYAYDLDGNLISDASEEIAQIHWNASGKVTRIERAPESGKHDLLFLYDALGNRYGKVSSVGDAPISEANITMYIRDAQGNPLEIYDYSFEDLGDNEYRESLKLNERIFYGSSRIATETSINEEVAFAEFSVSSGDYPYDGNPFAKIDVSTTFVDPDPKKFSLIRGRKHFELTNHLGNVLATVSDKRIPIDGKYSWVLGAAGTGDYNFVDGGFVYDAGNGNYEQDEAPDGTIDFYMPKVTMANRYYPFGMLMPGHSYSSGSYPYGWNTQESVDEVAGVKQHYTAKFWEYDPRAVLRWNTDPVPMPWESPYAINRSNPIWHNDPFGDCPTCDEMGTSGDYAVGATTTDNGVPYMRTETGWDRVQDGGTMPEATASASRGLSSNPIHRNMEMKGINSYGSGIKWGEGLGYQTEFSKGLDVFPKMLAVGLAPMAISSMAPIAGEAVGMAFKEGLFALNTKGAGLVSSATDFGSQMINGQGSARDRFERVNWMSVGASGLLSSPFTSAAVGSSFNYSIYGQFQTIGSSPDMSLSKVTIDFTTGFATGKIGNRTQSLLSVPNEQLIFQSVFEPMITVPSAAVGEAVKQKLD